MKIDFYYWGEMCPYNSINIGQLKKLEKIDGYKIGYYDFSRDQGLAKEKSFYSPTFTIINGSIRWTGPLLDRDIEGLAEGVFPVRNVDDFSDGKIIISKELKDLNFTNAHYLKDKCTMNHCGYECEAKGEWISKLQRKYNLDLLGIIHIDGDRCIGGAEFVPSFEVPYDIPRSEDTAFLTCLYSSDNTFDFKTTPLRKLEGKLVEKGFNNISAVVSPKRNFPNGSMEWFLERGYEKGKFLYREECDKAEQYLVSKHLISNKYKPDNSILSFT